MSYQLSPLSCCACACDPSVIVNLYGAAGGACSVYGGDDDPIASGFIPDDPAAWSIYYQTIPGDGAILTTWTWNPDYLTWK